MKVGRSHHELLLKVVKVYVLAFQTLVQKVKHWCMYRLQFGMHKASMADILLSVVCRVLLLHQTNSYTGRIGNPYK